MTPAIPKTSVRKPPGKPATVKTSTRKSPRKLATKAGRSPTVANRAKRGHAQASSNTVASQLPCISTADAAAAKAKFEQGILARGEAAHAGKPLPAGATHEITGRTPDGSPILKRKRFSML